MESLFEGFTPPPAEPEKVSIDINSPDIIWSHEIGYACPNCKHGNDIPIFQTEPEYNEATSMECGSACHDWIEVYQCSNCKTLYKLKNGDA